MAETVGEGPQPATEPEEGEERSASERVPGPVRVGDERGFAHGAAALLARALREAAARGPVSLALAGGGTPVPVYRSLAALPGLPWPRVSLFFSDERRVPPEHPRSNYRMVCESLLERLPAPPAAIYRLEGEAADPEAAARRYARLLPDSLELLILGVGTDGHTASLFPGQPALRENLRRVAPSEAPAAPRGRLTITPPVIRAAHRLFVLATGPSKARAVRRGLLGDWEPDSCPAQLARRGSWLLDRDAAAGLAGRVEAEELSP
ncbi:MAG: 6-phosphogluconolactonase [Gemmatimonadota bacterium]